MCAYAHVQCVHVCVHVFLCMLVFMCVYVRVRACVHCMYGVSFGGECGWVGQCVWWVLSHCLCVSACVYALKLVNALPSLHLLLLFPISPGCD